MNTIKNIDLPSTMPAPHRAFLLTMIEAFQSDDRIVGVAAGGSYLTNTMDEWSDLDFVVVVGKEHYDAVMAERYQIARSLGPLLNASNGEHVGEPRLFLCLYGPPLLQVDLKFLTASDLARRVEDPAILWERDGEITRALQTGIAIYPAPNPQWIEERFWKWIHYGASKIARGELFEAINFISFLRVSVLGPLALLQAGARPSGVRRIETAAPEFAEALQQTVATYDAASCIHALRACVALYRELRRTAADVQKNEAVEREVMIYLEEVERLRCSS